MSFRIFSSAFAEGGTIPRLHTCAGADVSPSLEWSDVPAGTRSFALIVDDPDAPAKTWTHWVLFDIPANTRTLAQGTRVGVNGRNDFGRTGYGGPCPPAGPPHRYYFRLYALDIASLGIAEDATRASVEAATEGHVLGEAQCMGRFGL
jgi:Raf kinase inhibitor-like YbhB/YbcL family protein